jgi:signal transduction histidine kinase/ligand-binding sensor domain-containing protein/CheY-like chemotaxis protein/AraC-like DNA-binding protein
MRNFLFATLLVSLFTGNNVWAQHSQFQFSRLDIHDGLSHNGVTSIMKDSKGFMWFGTISGLNKYDGFKFKVYRHSSKDSTTIDDDFIVNITEGPGNKIWVEMRNRFNIFDPVTETFNHDVAGYLRSINIYDAFITSIKKDPSGNFWFLHPGYGIYKYNPSAKTTAHIKHKPGDNTSISSNDVADVTLDSNGNAWLIYYNGLLEELNGRNEVVYRSDIISRNNASATVPYKLFIDNKGDFWAYVATYSSGVYYLSADRTVFKHLDKGNGPQNLSTNVISQIIQDDKNNIWIATDQGGINILDKSNFKIKVVLNREDDNKSLSQNGIIAIYKDNTGIIWIGTFKKGISYYDENIIKFPLYTHHFSDPNSLPFNDVNKFIEDKYGNLWVGTNGGGLIYFDRKNNKFKSYLNNPADPNSLSNNVIVAMYMDHSQKLWIGTYFGGLDCFDGKTFVHYRHNDAIPGSISEDRIWSILEDADRHLWVGTLAGGLNLFHPETKTFTHFTKDAKNSTLSLSSNYVPALLQDHNKNLWIVTSYGIDVMMYKTHAIIHYKHDEHKSNSLADNNTDNVFEDSRGLIWITTRGGGVSIFNPLTNKFQNISKDDGLPDNTCIDLEEDSNHSMWLSTANGLSNIIVNKTGSKLNFNFINYNETDGLQGREFNAKSSCNTREGELIFGGANGFNLFNPLNVHIGNTPANLVFTDLQVFNQSVRVGEKINGHVILNQSITSAPSVTLRHDEDAFAIAFASLNYFNPDKIEIQYKMQGFDKDWIIADNAVRRANYTNLDAGDYTFKVRTLYKNIVNKEISLAIHILPPFWKTPLAYLLYAAVFAGSLFFIRKRGIKRLKTQFELEKEREEAKRMHELDLMKIKFFTNISHEFRTPLSLIMGPIEKVLGQIKEPGTQKQLEFANRNAKRLLNMVNQLLDFRKLESQELKLNTEAGEIVSFISEIALSFNDIAEKKNISFIFNTQVDELNCEFDRDKIERILFNILSNAFKFTPPGGHVSVLVNAGKVDNNNCKLEIKVIDTGIGITPEKINRIFEPFFQDDIPASVINQGSGIGLSITKEFVSLHNGTIKAESQNNEGSTFTVVIPLKVIPAIAGTTIKKETAGLTAETVNAVDKTQPGLKKPTVLIVEDDYDFRFYIKDNLKNLFTIIEATNGKEGWQKALASHPNIIVSDISMPEMDGIELCRKVKSDSRTTHIPVILLTAVTGEAQQLKGLETGAADYITKPFNFEILLSKIRNLLVQQENMRKTYQKQVEVKPTEVIVESPDEVFLQKLLRLIDENISNPNFSVEELSGNMFMSRYTLYKKILALTGKTPNEFIRYMRLKRAAQLLENDYLTVSQICYKVGFRSQKYFVKTFKSEYSVSPSKYSNLKDHAEV